MKVKIGKYIRYSGPYQIADWLQKVGVSEDTCFRIGEKLSNTWLNDLCEWIQNKRKRTVKVTIHDYDVWNMDYTLSLIVYPMLLRLRVTKHGAPSVDDEDVPEELRSSSAEPLTDEQKYHGELDENYFKRWDYVMDEMIFAFEKLSQDTDWESEYQSGEFDHSKKIGEPGWTRTFTSDYEATTQNTSPQVVAQNQPDFNVNESSNGQANANQPIADQAVGTPSPETVTAPVVAKESQPQPASNVEQISESYLKDVDLLKEHAGKWKYRYAVGANWQTANSKESAIERAQEAHQKAIANGDPLPTKNERYATSETEQTTQMEQRYGKMSIPELEKEHARLGGVVSDLQQTGKNEFNGNGGRRTGAATANEGARDTGLEKMRLEGYIQTRKEREADNKTESYDERLNSRQERIKSATSNKEIDKVIAEQEADTERDWDTTRSLGIKAENRKRQIESHEDQQKTNEMLDAGKSVYATSFKSGQAANSYVEKKNKEDPDFEYTHIS